MTYVYPSPFQHTWNGPVCPGCGRGYIQQTWTTTTPTYQPRHRKPGPAQ